MEELVLFIKRLWVQVNNYSGTASKKNRRYFTRNLEISASLATWLSMATCLTANNLFLMPFWLYLSCAVCGRFLPVFSRSQWLRVERALFIYLSKLELFIHYFSVRRKPYWAFDSLLCCILPVKLLFARRARNPYDVSNPFKGHNPFRF